MLAILGQNSVLQLKATFIDMRETASPPGLYRFSDLTTKLRRHKMKKNVFHIKHKDHSLVQILCIYSMYNVYFFEINEK